MIKLYKVVFRPRLPVADLLSDSVNLFSTVAVGATSQQFSN